MKVPRAEFVLFACAGLAFGLGCGWLALGIYSDREFGGLYVFVKHWPSPRFYFYAPLGESDTPISTLSPDGSRAEAAFHDFVEVHGGNRRKLCLLP